MRCGSCDAGLAPLVTPETYTARHPAERILPSRRAIEGARKQVTVLFADVKGAGELTADRDPERTTGVTLSIRIGLKSDAVVVRSIGSDLYIGYSAVGCAFGSSEAAPRRCGVTAGGGAHAVGEQGWRL